MKRKLAKTSDRVQEVVLNKKKYKEGNRKSYPEIALNDPRANKLHDFPTNAISSQKYTVFTFIPKLLWEQFRKLTTTYFLIIVIISCFPSVSPFAPWSTSAGFVFILVVAAIREAVEDILRFKADLKVNRSKYKVLDNKGNLCSKMNKDIRVGDLVYVESDQQIPADLVVLASPLPDGLCFIETAQLDGETNLKLRKAPKETFSLSRENLVTLQGKLECEVPQAALYTFQGRLTLVHENSSDTIPLNTNHLLLKNTNLRNTPWVIGVVVYAGPETKLALNQKAPPSKMSTLDKRINQYVIGLLIFQIALCCTCGIGAGLFNARIASKSWYYMPENLPKSWEIALRTFVSYFALLSYLIPLSLVVSLELIKMLQARFMQWDNKMRDKHGKGMVAKTSNLNDDLGLVEYVFSDKTGTLTENQMIFRACSIRGRAFQDSELDEILKGRKKGKQNEIQEFLTILSLCHNVVTDVHKETGDLIYKAASPDEEALVKAAAAHNFRFLQRTNNGAQLEIDGTQQIFPVLELLEFSSSRGRMSVVVRTPDNKIMLYSKGADSVMLQRLKAGDDELRAQTIKDLSLFSKQGLRTLIVARRELSPEVYNSFHEGYLRASALLENRDEEVENLCDKFERELEIVGATAIEDKLQEHVPETIHYLLSMAIKVWVITGDKQETAINIGYSTRLLRNDMELVIINATTSGDCLELLTSKTRNIQNNLALVIDGATLKFALDDHPDAFLELAQHCRSVVCCRVTPLQKAKVVRLVKENTGAICLAIGDGANDVGMIQEAHVGVGIFGKEGTQAARASDFALRQFKHLQRLLSIHGRYSLVRSAGVIHYSLYKNTCIFLPQIWFSFYSGFSGQSLFDDWVMTLFNIAITSLPPLVYGVFEKDISEKLINTHPAIYNRTQSKKVFTVWQLLLWMTSAIYHSLVLFFGALYLACPNQLAFTNGLTLDLVTFGNVVMSIGILVIFLKLALHTSYWTMITHTAYWGSILVYYGLLVLESYWFSMFPSQYHMIERICSSPFFYLWMVLAVGLCLVPDLAFRLIKRFLYPEDWEILSIQYRSAKKTGLHTSMIAESPFVPENENSLDQPLLSKPVSGYNSIRL